MAAKQRSRKGAASSAYSSEEKDPRESAAIKTVVSGTAIMLKELICPPCVRTRVKFSQRVQIASTTGALGTYLYRANGLDDPDVTGAGAQPEGFDEWMAMYDRYRVVSSKIKITGASQGTTNNSASFLMVIVPSGSATAYATLADAESAPFAARKMYVFGGPPLVISKSISTATLTGNSVGAILAEQAFSGLFSTQPTEQTYWHVYVQAMDAASTVTTNVYVEIEYVADFFDRNNFALSVSADGSRKLVRKVAMRSREVVSTPPPVLVKRPAY